MKRWLLVSMVVMLTVSLLLNGCSKKQYDFTIAVNGQGTISPGAGTYQYEDGKSVTISVTAANGWKFDGWSGDATGTNEMITIIMDGKKGITANFSKITYNLNILLNGSGQTDPNAGSTLYDSGTPVNITAIPSNGWKFDGWTGDISGSNSTVIVTMDRTKQIIANFSKITYILTMAVKGTGTTDPPIGGHGYDAGSTINISAIPDSASEFKSWSGDVTSPTSATTTLTLTQDATITANFSKKPISYGPVNVNIGTGYKVWTLSLKTGDIVNFGYTVAGSDVSYQVNGPNNLIISPMSSKAQSGRSSFIASIPGNYQILLQSQGIFTSSVVTFNYAIYPAP